MCRSALRNSRTFLGKFCPLLENQSSSPLHCTNKMHRVSEVTKKRSSATFERALTSKCEVLSLWLVILSFISNSLKFISIFMEMWRYVTKRLVYGQIILYNFSIIKTISDLFYHQTCRDFWLAKFQNYSKVVDDPRSDISIQLNHYILI